MLEKQNEHTCLRTEGRPLLELAVSERLPCAPAARNYPTRFPALTRVEFATSIPSWKKNQQISVQTLANTHVP